ncbi:hypothetical protein HMPREF0454_01822 [Hafnia alvei ATCC 51873]|uniref:Uncharacterized protein n=1 Tax=Hafnia alvei ATCC 51873 TaxID=1002364 RepID=G9Y5L3_HAFAL|nr:hypothetical protein HMPREF0454_01822 [Hafnia alvei ATCC 51873]
MIAIKAEWEVITSRRAKYHQRITTEKSCIHMKNKDYLKPFGFY